ncbi:polynucleotide adenylyltransferase PcnB [Alysiella crassa]|uniref:Poly(A) polymerase I n=1 Tax=Alysiella crassa TaxID=153491 RepID=A0A376BMJ1_9NEIS|nr:polynucleotide adenylyltransferase PcnB [Alysiella crassa]SSY70833.1 Poly(A) polymerase precursor [Alysiella crassa]
MLKKMIGTVLQKRRRKNALQHERHAVHLALPPTAAEDVIRKLVKAGFEAYLVGGAVRDLLLGVRPKDFDVATNATPEQITALFRRSRIIGKRFPIVHVLAGAETVEVSTFRSGQSRQNTHGRIMKDNAYGTLEQDAVRRDFTCNALYYDVIHHQVIDFHDGIKDIAAKKLVMIGDPSARYQEDPVRMLRAVRLAGKLGFVVDADTAAPITELADLLKHEPVSRLFDEMLKILFSGNALGCLKQIDELGLNSRIHPILTALQNVQDKPMILKSLQQTDWRLQQGKSVSMGFILAAMFWEDVAARWTSKQEYMPYTAALASAVSELRDELERGWGMPQHYSATMREIWLLQANFDSRRGAKPFKFLAQPRFRAAYDFLLIRAEFGEVPQELADWWTAFQHGNEQTRNNMVSAQNNTPKSPNEAPSKRKRKPRKRKPKPKAVEE